MNNQELTIKIAIDTMTKSDSAKVNIRLGEYFRPIADHNAIIDLSGDNSLNVSSTASDAAVDSLRRADAQILTEAVDACNSLIIAITQAQTAQREAQLDRDAIDQQQLEQSHAGEHGGQPEGDAF
jgi:hypothetical protein